MEECSLAVKVMILLNFSHPLTAAQPERVEALARQRVVRVIGTRGGLWGEP